MENVLKDYEIKIGESAETPFLQRAGIYQDGTTPMFRDENGKLWAMSGHSHMGHIGMFCGTCLDDLKEVYPIDLNFCVGHADYAFDKIRYPEGIKARGSVWPFGLYICPNTHRFFAFFHNETGWVGKGTAYDAFGLCETPKYDSDFRHIGMMHSDDEGKTWTFDRWVLTAEKPCFTTAYNPQGDKAVGQKLPVVQLGSGDFSLFVDEKGGWLYLFYNIAAVDLEKGCWTACDVYVARSRIRGDGLVGDFVKYYDGAFCEAGNLGKETAIVKSGWHPRVAYFEELGKYVLSCSKMVPNRKFKVEKIIEPIMQLRTGNDLLHWSEPVQIPYDDGFFGNHYTAILPNDKGGQANVVKGEEFSILTNHNATNVLRFPARLIKK